MTISLQGQMTDLVTVAGKDGGFGEGKEGEQNKKNNENENEKKCGHGIATD